MRACGASGISEFGESPVEKITQIDYNIGERVGACQIIGLAYIDVRRTI